MDDFAAAASPAPRSEDVAPPPPEPVVAPALAALAPRDAAPTAPSTRPATEPGTSLVEGLKGLFIDVAKVVVAILLIWHFVAHPSVVKGQSMEPTFHNDDRLMVDLLTYRFTGIERGDIVVLKNPSKPNEDFIKRVIGLPGESVEIVNGEVRINGIALDEPYLKSLERRSFKRATVPPAHYFVLGDNRGLSKDSRDPSVAWIPEDYIRGKIRLRFWPLSQIELF